MLVFDIETVIETFNTRRYRKVYILNLIYRIGEYEKETKCLLNCFKFLKFYWWFLIHFNTSPLAKLSSNRFKAYIFKEARIISSKFLFLEIRELELQVWNPLDSLCFVNYAKNQGLNKMCWSNIFHHDSGYTFSETAHLECIKFAS